MDPGGLTQVYVDLEDALNNTIITLAATESGFRATTKRGVVHFDAEGNPTQYTGFPALGIGTYIMHMIPEGDGYLASSVMGLYRLDQHLQCTDTLHAATMDVISMTRMEHDQLWAVSMNEGLLRWQDDHLVSEDFPSKQLFTLLITPEGKWITGAQGLYRHTNQGVWTLNAASGIPIDEYDQNGVWQASNGRLYFGGVGGVVGMEPANMSPSEVWPSLAWPEELTLDYDQGEAVVHLETITAVAPDNHRMYVLHESDTTWIKPGVRELVVHAPYGESALTWHAERLSDGEHMTRTLPILRAYPFWTAWWFWVIIAVLVAALVAGGYSLFKFLQTRRLLRTEQAQKKVTEERLRISRELHDNIGARLTHIISSLDVEMYQREESAEPLANINAFARQTMAQLRETIWAVSDKTVFFSEFATRVDQYAAETRRLTGIDVRVSNWVQGDFQLNPVQTINFFRILQEAINNAVKYAEPQGIDVGMQWTPGEYARFVVEDDGVGFDPKHHAHGTGVNGMRQRAQEADADFSLTSAPGQGTRIEVTFAPE